MKKNIVSVDPAMKNGYIPAPYVLEEGEKINDFYLEPVIFRNTNGPDIGVTTCGVIVKTACSSRIWTMTESCLPMKIGATATKYVLLIW